MLTYLRGILLLFIGSVLFTELRSEPSQVHSSGCLSEALLAENPSLREIATKNNENISFSTDKTQASLEPIIDVQTIQVKGQKRMTEKNILAYLKMCTKGKYTQNNLDLFVKQLFKTELFEDVSFSVNDGTLTIHVVENPYIQKISFKKNKKISTEDFLKAIPLKERHVSTKHKLQESQDIIKEMYKEKGFNQVVVDIQTVPIKHARHQVEIVITTEEKVHTPITSIKFIGNKNLSASKLAKTITSKRKVWYRLFGAVEESLNIDRLRYDEELLRVLYLNEGYLDVHIPQATAVLNQKKDGFIVTFTVQEGKRYRLGKVDFASKCDLIEKQTPIMKHLASLAIWKKGSYFSQEKVQAACDAMSETLDKKNFLFTEMNFTLKKQDNHSVDVLFTIVPTEKRYIDSIDIQGNLATNESVIRRELRVQEGDIFSVTRILQSQAALKRKGFFESVEFLEEMGHRKEGRKLIFKVKETSTGGIFFRGSYSTLDGIMGSVSYSDINVLGKGQNVNAGFTVSKRGGEISAGITNPRFLNRDLLVGVNGSISRLRSENFYDTKVVGSSGNKPVKHEYEQESVGANLNISYPLLKHLSQAWSLGLTRQHFSAYGKKENLSLYIIDNMKGHETLVIPSLNHTFLYDRLRYSQGNPSNGWSLRLDTTLVGWSGNVPDDDYTTGSLNFISNILRFQHYLALDQKNQWILRFEARYGDIAKFGYMRFTDQFMLRYQDCPAFLGMGPIDTKTGDFLGGKSHYLASLKLYFPVMKDLPIQGVLYYQMGSLWSSIFKGDSVEGNAFYNRSSLGAGVILQLPFVGKIGFLFSKVLDKSKFDKEQWFSIIFGYDF